MAWSSTFLLNPYRTAQAATGGGVCKPRTGLQSINAPQLFWRGGVSAPLEMKVTGPGSRKQEAGSNRMVDEVCLVAILFDLQRLRTKQKDERGGRGKRRERGGGGRAGQQVWAFGFGSGKILMTN